MVALDLALGVTIHSLDESDEAMESMKHALAEHREGSPAAAHALDQI
jgi:hypothetical protein